MRFLTPLLLVFLTACSFTCSVKSTTPLERCEEYADLACEKLEACMSYNYDTCYKRFIETECEDVVGIRYSYADCMSDLMWMTCEDQYPPDSCDDALIYQNDS